MSPGEEAALRANVAMQRALGARAEVIDAARLKEVAPGLRADDVECAAWEPNGGYGDGAVVAGDLLAAARARGVRYRPHSPVASLLTDGGRVTGVELAGSGSGTGEGGTTGSRADGSGGDRVYADTVVLAAGVWSPPLLRAAGVVLPIETELHRVAVLAHPAGAGAPVACIDSANQTYFRPEAAGAMTLAGAFYGPRGADPDAAAAAADEDLAPLVQAAARRVPALEDAGIARGVTGVYDMTPDARPLLGRLPGLDGLIVAAGFSGMGFKIAPAVGEGIAGLIADAPAGGVDLTPFRPGRLAKGRRSSHRTRTPMTDAHWSGRAINQSRPLEAPGRPNRARPGGPDQKSVPPAGTGRTNQSRTPDGLDESVPARRTGWTNQSPHADQLDESVPARRAGSD